MKTHFRAPLIVIIFTSFSSATIINVPTDQSTIQAGIDAATADDTVIVQPGTYNEHINFNGKNIVVGSLFLTTGDPSYISNTVIDGEDDHHSGVSFSSGEDSTAVLTGFTITNFDTWGDPGGGIRCIGSGPTLMNLIISDNLAWWGGGIFCIDGSSPNLLNVTVSGNINDYGGFSGGGGGIFCENSEMNLLNVIVRGNTSWGLGGGIYCDSSKMNLRNVTISDNCGYYGQGGGIICWNGSRLNLANVTVTKNRAGGISCNESSLNFDAENRCNIYLNHYRSGRDLKATNLINVIVDTFTVMNPTNYYAYPMENFTFDILQAKLEPVSRDLYVSPDGDNVNSGQSASEPLKTISFALAKIMADRYHPKKIYLSEGVYSASTCGEIFPLYLVSYVSLFGESKANVILNAEGEGYVIGFVNNQGNAIENLTVTGGSSGISCHNSDPSLMNVAISGNSNYGIKCGSSSPQLTNVTISRNFGGGIFCLSSSDPTLMNVTVSGNRSDHPHRPGGGITCQYGSNPTLVNTILWNNSPHEIGFVNYEGSPNSITIAYSDIQGGETGIVTNNRGTVYWLEDNINTDPLFVDMFNEDYHLSDYSPCIGAGIDFIEINGNSYYTPDSDYEGNPRPNPIGSRPDMGAYESELSSPITGIKDIKQLPEKYELAQNHPNPFNPSTTIKYALPKSEHVSITVYNTLGQMLGTLINKPMSIGHHQLEFNGKNLSSGVYLYRIEAGNFQDVKKMVLLR